MKGDLLAASLGGSLYRIELNSTGDGVVSPPQALFSNVGSMPVDVTTRGDTNRFPGTIWVANIGDGTIEVFEPSDYGQVG